MGDLPLGSYTRENARAVRDVFASGRSTATVRRRLNTIRAVFTHGLKEFGLTKEIDNHFKGLQITNEGEDAKKRLPFSTVELKAISTACQRLNDDIRWIVALQLDTGARLSEIVGLRASDVFVSGETPFVWIKEHRALGHTLKTANSERKVPLVGLSLWGAQRAAGAAETLKSAKAGWLFPRYASDGNIKSTYASNTINKWLSKSLSIPKTSHSFRHSMRDRLRVAGAPSDIQDAIGGWSSGRSVGESYGLGHKPETLKPYLDKVVLT